MISLLVQILILVLLVYLVISLLGPRLQPPADTVLWIIVALVVLLWILHAFPLDIPVSWRR
jgi:hypothetical protein